MMVCLVHADGRYQEVGFSQTRLTAGDSIPTKTLVELARGSDVFIEGIIGPLPDLDVLSWQSRFLINVRSTRYDPPPAYA